MANADSQMNGRGGHVSQDGIVGWRNPPNAKAFEMMWWNHMPAAEIREQLGHDVFDRYFKFCVIRDPFDKVVSAFYWKTKRSDKPMSRMEKERLRQDFELWLFRGRLPIDRNKYVIDGAICVNYFIRYETLHQGIKHVCDLLDIPFEITRIGQRKSGIRPKGLALADYYTQASVELVAKAYDFEIRTFGYTPPI